MLKSNRASAEAVRISNAALVNSTQLKWRIGSNHLVPVIAHPKRIKKLLDINVL